MLDILTIPLFAIGAFFGVSYFVSPETVVIDTVSLPAAMEDRGYNPESVANLMSDTLAKIADRAGTNRGNYVSEGSAEANSVEALSDWFGLAQPIRAAQIALGFLPYAFTGEFIEEGDELVLRISGKSQKFWHYESSVRGTAEDVPGLVTAGALELLSEIDPYVVAVYHFRREFAGKDFPNTRDAIDHALIHSPRRNLPWVYALWGHVLMEEGDFDGAIMKFRQALVLDPAFPRPMMRWGEALLRTGRTDDAIGRFKKTLEIEPIYPEAVVFWGQALLAKGEIKAAGAKFREAYQMAPGFPRIIHAYGLYQEEYGDRALAADLLRRAVELTDGHNAKFVRDLVRVQGEIDPHALQLREAG